MLFKGLEKIATFAEIFMVVCGDFNLVLGLVVYLFLLNGCVFVDYLEFGIDFFGIL